MHKRARTVAMYFFCSLDSERTTGHTCKEGSLQEMRYAARGPPRGAAGCGHRRRPSGDSEAGCAGKLYMSTTSSQAYLAPAEEALVAAVARVLDERPSDPVQAIGRMMLQMSAASADDDDDEGELRKGDWASNRAACARQQHGAHTLRCALSHAAASAVLTTPQN